MTREMEVMTDEERDRDYPPGPSLNPASDGFTLTADGNIIHVRATLRYRISDPISYAFNYANAGDLVQNALNNALFYASARFTVDNALRNNIEGFRETVLSRAASLIEEQGLGITLEPSDIITAAPRQVKASFADVLAAQQDASNARNTALAYANGKLNTAQGEATALINAGQTARTRLVQSVEAEAKYFMDQLPFYQRDPELFKQRLLIETFQRIFTNAAMDKYFVPDRADGKPRELRIMLNREPEKPKLKEPDRPETTPLTKDTRRR